MELTELDRLRKFGNSRFVTNINNVRNITDIDIIAEYKVQKQFEHKIWAISEYLFATPNFADILLHFNNLSAHNIPEGTVIKIPNLNDYAKTNDVNVKTSQHEKQSTTTITRKRNKDKLSIAKDGRLVITSSRTK